MEAHPTRKLEGDVTTVANALAEKVQLKDAKMDAPKKADVNGLTQWRTQGSGTNQKGADVGVGVNIVTGAKKTLIVFALGDLSKNQDAVESVYKSIKKL